MPIPEAKERPFRQRNRRVNWLTLALPARSQAAMERESQVG